MLHVSNVLVFTYQQHCKPIHLQQKYRQFKLRSFAKAVFWNSCYRGYRVSLSLVRPNPEKSAGSEIA